MATRKEKAQAITQSVLYWCNKYNQAIVTELGLCSWGELRADIVTVTMSNVVSIIEVKSCKADFDVDQKFEKYLPYCNKMYIAIYSDDEEWLEKHYAKLKGLNIGVLILDDRTGYVFTRVKCSYRKMKKKTKRLILTRMVFKNSPHNGFKKRRVRVFLK